MSYPINYPTPQGANVQIFQEGGTTSDWVKPQGASFVWFTLIGAGSAYDTSFPRAGGSGAVVNCMVPAFLTPDTLLVTVGAGPKVANVAGGASIVSYRIKGNYTLLTAAGGQANGAGGSADAGGPFTAAGFFQSIGGQDGTTGINQNASATTFLSGGTTGGWAVNGNYGYSAPVGGPNGFFQMQPIIVGLGAANKKAGTGCGGAYGATGAAGGGDGMVVIITW